MTILILEGISLIYYFKIKLNQLEDLSDCFFFSLIVYPNMKHHVFTLWKLLV